MNETLLEALEARLAALPELLEGAKVDRIKAEVMVDTFTSREYALRAEHGSILNLIKIIKGNP